MKMFGRLRIIFLICIVCIACLTACGNAAAAQWQEQYDLGVRYLSEGDFENAIVAFQAAIEIDPKRAEAYVGVARAYVGLGDEESAIEWLQKGIETADDTGEIAAMLTELGVEVPEAAAPEGGSTDATQGQSAAPSAQGEGDAAADEVDTWGDDETLVAMMRSGANFTPLHEEEYTALGVPFFESATVENLRSAAAAAGLEVTDQDSGFDAIGYSGEQIAISCIVTRNGGATSVAEDGTETVAALRFDLDCQSPEGYGTPVGMYGLVMGDSFETALTKLGFSNAKEITDYCNSHLENERQFAGVSLGETDIVLEYNSDERGDTESGSSLGVSIYFGGHLENWAYFDSWNGRLNHVHMVKF